MSQLWQHPYVNTFKHFEIQSWKKASKEGEVTSLMDKTLKGTIYKITGSIPAGNYIQLPKTSSQSLGLTGRYMYLLFRPVPSKYFSVHIDIATQDGLIVRISFSNLFKEFKSTSTWLQFPFVCNASKGSVGCHTSTVSKGQVGPAPMSTRWTVLNLDFQSILSLYLNRKYSYIKSIKLCANMMVKNIFTSDMDYEPGFTFEEVKKTGVTLTGLAPMPRDMAFPLGKGQKWHEHYDLIKFPSETSKMPFDSIQYTKKDTNPDVSKNGPVGLKKQPRRVNAKTVHTVKAGQKVNLIDHVTCPKNPFQKRSMVTDLPMVGVDNNGDISVEPPADDSEVHVYAHPNDHVRVVKPDKSKSKVDSVKIKAPLVTSKKENYTALSPDPILKLKRIVGFGGSSTKDAIWVSNGAEIVYPCHAVVVSMQVANGHQRFFIGHTDKVSCVSLSGSSSLLASGQTGPQSVVRVWRYRTGECLAMFKTHVHSLHCLSMSNSGGVLCGVGKDGHGKNMVVIWNTDNVSKGGQVSVLAKAHTDVDIQRMRLAGFDDTRMVSCGRDNIRLWRVKDGSLRSAPVNLGEHHLMEFTDCCFEAGYEATKDPLDRMVYACSKSGHIFEVDYRRVAIHHVRRLLPMKPGNKEKQTFNSGPGIAINCMSINEAFCATGSEDGYLRLWPLDFSQVYLEAEHEGPVTAVDISGDGIKILAGTSTGNLGLLDISTRGYTTVMRSHTSRVVSMDLDPVRRHMATVSEDHTIRIWDLDTMQQLYDFSAPKECPCAITYHPREQVFACGFESGAVRVFNVATTSMLAEHKQHRGRVTGLAFCPTGDYLYSCGSLGSLALYDASEHQYPLLRLLGNTVARGDSYAPEALAPSPDGRALAFVGPTEFTVSVVDGRSLDEIMRIDITSINPHDSARNVIDSAVNVKYAPSSVKQLLVTTSNNRLLKFDGRNGKILTEIDNIHRSGCSALHVSGDGRHLTTAGDKVIKIWDYHMRLDLNFQVFIGHSERISKLLFTPDSLGFISIGEAIFFWDFLAKARDVGAPEGRTTCKNYFTGEEEEFVPYNKTPALPPSDHQSDLPRSQAPRPAPPPTQALPYPQGRSVPPTQSLPYPQGRTIPRTPPRRGVAPGENITDCSIISKTNDDIMGEDIVSMTSGMDNMVLGPDQRRRRGDNGHNEDVDTESHPIEATNTLRASVNFPNPRFPGDQPTTPTKRPASKPTTPNKGSQKVEHPQPSMMRHFSQREKAHALAQRRYTAPPNQAGLKLKSVIGYNGNGRDNMVWQADTGVFCYSSGCIVICEDLSNGTQQHLLGHTEEVSTLALQNDCQVLASASAQCGSVPSQICLWDLTTMTCSRTLTQHQYNVVAMSYARDDRFLLTLGDYRDCSVVVWSTASHSVLCATHTSAPMTDICWDPYTVNEFSTVGVGGAVLFWLLDETGGNHSLSVHEGEPPKDLLLSHHMPVCDCVDFTCLEYAGDSTLYVATNNGKVSAWDTRHNTCFMHWEADTHEIATLISRHGRLITGSSGRSLKLWSVVGVGEMRAPGDGPPGISGGQGLTMEDEMNLDGGIISAAFDDTMDMGIVGTTAGTIWYINWTERTSIRLVSGHAAKVNAVAVCSDDIMATCSTDGSLRVWSVHDREQTLQFQVLEQSCNCLAFSPVPRDPPPSTPTLTTHVDGGAVVTHTQRPPGDRPPLPHVTAGYSDGTVRMFDLNKVEMVLKMHPHAVAVTAISFSADGRMILSGGSDGLVAISSPTTGMTVRVVGDHKGAPISCIDVAFITDTDTDISAPMLWLAASADRRVSVWSADWSKDYCELIDWLTFPAPAFTPDGSTIKEGDQGYYQSVPPTLARFSCEEPDVVVYTGYGMQKQVQFYSLSQRKVLRTVALTHWATALEVSPTAPLIAVGVNERLLKLVDYYEGSFQDFTGHDDSVQLVKFDSSGKFLMSAAYNDIICWDVNI